MEESQQWFGERGIAIRQIGEETLMRNLKAIHNCFMDLQSPNKGKSH